MTRIIVTGGAGFLGSHLCARLIAAGQEVMCVDDFSGGQGAPHRAPPDNDALTLLEHDIVTPFEAEATAICNFACPPSPVHHQVDPVQTLLTSVNGTLDLLAVARRHGATLLQASTSEVYGDPEVHP